MAVRDLPLTFAVNDYDHVRDVVSGAVPVEGVQLTCLILPVEEIFFRFSRHREWHVTELSLAKFASLLSRGEPVVGIPAFPSRAFRHSALFVREDDPIDDPSALRGKRIGIPEWTQTATVYVRGFLAEQYGVDLASVSWVQGGVNEPGRVEGIPIDLPEGVRYRSVSDATLSELLLTGELDAIISAPPPEAFKTGRGGIRRLFRDHRAVEAAHHSDTGIFPIMHVVALRGDVYERDPWVAMNLFTALQAAKRRSLERLTEANTARIPLPWCSSYADEVRETFGHDFWPYGIEPNRPTLEAFLRYAHDQRVTARRLQIEELFAPEVRETYRI